MDQFIPETIQLDEHADGVSCDGGGGALGHPKVWYSFDGQDSVECGYCDRLFVQFSGGAKTEKSDKSGAAVKKQAKA